MVNILFIGDVVAKPGRKLIKKFIPELKDKYSADLVIANGENAAGGLGITASSADEMFSAGVDVITTGNHVFRYKEITDYLDSGVHILRPLNYPEPAPGKGLCVVETSSGIRIGIANLLGRVFMAPLDCPFKAGQAALEKFKTLNADVTLFDLHAEATSEKRALGWMLDGQTAAVIGTHTHVQTADEEILPHGTAYITDAGMTGPHDSIIGMKTENIIQRFLTGRPTRFDSAKSGLRLEGVLVRVNQNKNTAHAIERVKVKG